MRKIVSLLFCLSALCASAQVSGYSLEQAATLLRQGIRIIEVAGRVGFTSSSYFAKCFKSCFGVLPKEFVSR